MVASGLKWPSRMRFYCVNMSAAACKSKILVCVGACPMGCRPNCIYYTSGYIRCSVLLKFLISSKLSCENTNSMLCIAGERESAHAKLEACVQCPSHYKYIKIGSFTSLGGPLRSPIIVWWPSTKNGRPELKHHVKCGYLVDSAYMCCTNHLLITKHVKTLNQDGCHSYMNGNPSTHNLQYLCVCEEDLLADLFVKTRFIDS